MLQVELVLVEGGICIFIHLFHFGQPALEKLVFVLQFA